MTDQISNKLPWAEIVSCVSLSERAMSSAATRHFEGRRFARARNRAARAIVNRVINSVLCSEPWLLDVAEVIRNEIHGISEAKALENCIDKVKELASDGWTKCPNEKPKIHLRYEEINVQLIPHSILRRGEDICLLYAYFRRSPPINTDAIRALICMVRLWARKTNYENTQIVVLDCYKNLAYEASDFGSEEKWIAKQLEKVLDRFSAAYKHHENNTMPPWTPETSLASVPDRMLRLTSSGIMDVLERHQLNLQLT